MDITTNCVENVFEFKFTKAAESSRLFPLFSSDEGLSLDEGVPTVALPYGLIDLDRTLPVDAGPVGVDVGKNLAPMSDGRRS